MDLIRRLLNTGYSARGVLPVLQRIKSVSFAMYAEDLLISHMRPQGRGFYVDVGAFHPQMHSNTYKLYLKGWSGLTIEPNPGVAETFRRARPRDAHLTLGIAEQESEMTYYQFRDGAQNTFDAERAAELQAERVGEVAVKCMPLNEVFERHCRDRPVDLLSVDCEARDLEVVQSLDWRRHRPTMLIIEDFEQFEAGGSPKPSSSAIRSFMLAHDYAVVSQAVFSFFYVDRHAFKKTDRTSGFRLDRSQLGLLGLE
jgi:FkbM family methyltransferase